MTHTDGSTRAGATLALRTRPLAESPALAAKAIKFLCEKKSSFAFGKQDAECVVPYLRWAIYPVGTSLYREGDEARTSYMLLLKGMCLWTQASRVAQTGSPSPCWGPVP